MRILVGVFCLFLASCGDAVEGTSCADELGPDAGDPIQKCFDNKLYRCIQSEAVWDWENCCYCRDGATYCTASCLDTGPG